MQSPSPIDIFSLQRKFGPNELPSLLEEVRQEYPNSEILIRGKTGNKLYQRIVIFHQGKLAYSSDRTLTLDNFVSLIQNKIDTDWVERIVESSKVNNEDELTPKKFCDRLLQMRVISKAELTKTLLSAYLLSLEVLWIGSGEITITLKSTEYTPMQIDWPALMSALEKRRVLWNSFTPLEHGFNSIPVITQEGMDALQAQFEAESQNAKLSRLIEQFIDGHSNISDLARRRNVDPLSLAQRVVDGIEKGWLEISDTSDTLYSKRANVLVIDDNPTTRKLLVTVLQEFYNAYPAPGSFSAIGVIPSKKIDLVIVSHSVPVTLGLRLCRVIRENSQYQNMPIIFLSSKENFFDRLKTKMAGVTDYINQPLDRTKIICTLDYYLN